MEDRALTVRAQALPAHMDTFKLADAFVKSGFFADTTQQAQAIVKITYGQEIGVGPVQAMMGIHIIKGKPSLSANLIGALIKRSGKYDYRVTDHTATACTVGFFEVAGGRREAIGTSTYTLDEAKKAGLTSNAMWEKYPKSMLYARALTAGARMYCADVFLGGVYTPEEMGAEVNEEGEPIVTDVTPTTQAVVYEPEKPAEPRQRAEASGSLCSPMQQRTIRNLLKQLGQDEKAITEQLGLQALGDLTEKRADKVITRLKELVMEQPAEPEQDGRDIFAGEPDRPNVEGVAAR